VLQTHLQQKLDGGDGLGCRGNISSSSPCFVYSRRQIMSNVQAYNSALSAVNMPYSIGYSVKVRRYLPYGLYYR